MKFFMTSEVEATIADEFRELRKEVEHMLKQLETKSYGEEVIEIGFIPIIIDLTPELEDAGFYKERIKYSKKNKDADVRLRINFDNFLNADYKKRKLLLVQNVLDSVRALSKKVKKGFDYSSLEQDIKELFNMDLS